MLFYLHEMDTPNDKINIKYVLPVFVALLLCYIVYNLIATLMLFKDITYFCTARNYTSR